MQNQKCLLSSFYMLQSCRHYLLYTSIRVYIYIYIYIVCITIIHVLYHDPKWVEDITYGFLSHIL